MHPGRLVLSGTNDKKECFFMSTQTRARKLTVTAMLSTIAFILMYVEFPIPALIPSFVKLDISDLPELLAAFSLGPVYGVVVSLLKNVLFSLLHGTSSAYVGETFNFIMGAVFSFSAGFIYKKYKWMLHCASSSTSRFRLCCISKGRKKAGKGQIRSSALHPNHPAVSSPAVK